MKKTRVKVSSASVYEQLRYKDHAEMEIKANLTVEIDNSIKKKGLTQTRAAKILGISQPKLSDLLRGHFRGYSIERLMHFLNELGKDVDIVIRSKQKRKARIAVYRSNGDRPVNLPMAAKSR